VDVLDFRYSALFVRQKRLMSKIEAKVCTFRFSIKIRLMG